MEHDLELRVITLKDLWDIFRQCWLIMLLSAVLVTGGFMLVNQLTFEPQYEAKATLYILREENTEENRSSDDFSLALKVVKDCDYLLKSHSVLDEVIVQQNLTMGYEELYQKVSTSNPTDTRILEVTVQADTPQSAKNIVDSICEIGTVKIEEAMGFQQVNLYEYGIMEFEPCNRTSITTYLVLAMMMLVLVYAAFFLLFLLDDRIRTEEDIERYLGLSILGDIPNSEDSKHKKGYNKYRGYSPYAGGKE